MFTIYADEQLLYSADIQEENPILSPALKLEMGKAGILDLVILPNHYLYNYIDKLKTKITVFMDETELFRGRVLNWEDDFYNQRTVHVEGDLAYLLDSIQPPRRVEITVTEFLVQVIAEHNLQVESDKHITLGQVTIDAANTVLTFDNNTYRDTRATIDEDLISVYGGFLRTRTVGTTTYLDYLKDYGTSVSQVLQFGTNILDLSKQLSSTEIYTVLLPLGDSVESTSGLPPLPVTIESVNEGSKLLENLDGIAKYGRIVHVESFSGITDPAALKAAAETYFDRVYIEPYHTFIIKAIDLHLFDTSIQQFSVGSTIRILSAPHDVDIIRTVLSINYDIENVENTELTIGPVIDLPDSTLSGQSLSQAVGSTLGGSSGGTLGQVLKYISEEQDWVKISANKIDLIGETITLQAGDISSLGAQIVIEKDRITYEVNRATDVEGTLSGRITVAASNIELKVSKNDVINAINVSNEGITIDGTKITITGENGIIVQGSLIIENELSAVSASINNLKSGITTATLLRTAQLICTGDISQVDSFSSNYITVGTSGSIYSLTTNNILNAANISTASLSLSGNDLQTLLAGKLGTGGKAADSSKLDGRPYSDFVLNSSLVSTLSNYCTETRVNELIAAATIAWSHVSDKPTAFYPTSHRHAYAVSETIANGHTHKVTVDGTEYTSQGVSVNATHTLSISDYTSYSGG